MFLDYLTGMPQNKIAQKYNTSKSKISRVINVHSSELNNNSNTIHEFFSSVQKMGIQLSDFPDIIHLHKIIKDSDMSIEQITEFAQKASKNESVDEIFNASQNIVYLSKNLGISISEIPEYCTDMEQKISNLNSEIESLQNKKNESENNLQSTLSENTVTKKELNSFIEQKNMLKKYGLNTDDVNLLINTLKNAKDACYDINAIIYHIEQEQKLVQRVKSIEDERKFAEKERLSIKEQIAKQTAYMKKNQKIVDIVKSLKTYGILPTHLESILQLINEISEKHGLSKLESLLRFQYEIEQNYDTLLGFDESIKELSLQKDQLENNLNDCKKHTNEKINQLNEELQYKKKEYHNAIILLDNEIEKRHTKNNSLEKQKTKIETYIDSLMEKTLAIPEKIIEQQNKYLEKMALLSTNISKVKLLDDFSHAILSNNYKECLEASLLFIDKLISLSRMQKEDHLPFISKLHDVKRLIEKQISYLV